MEPSAYAQQLRRLHRNDKLEEQPWFDRFITEWMLGSIQAMSASERAIQKIADDEFLFTNFPRQSYAVKERLFRIAAALEYRGEIER